MSNEHDKRDIDRWIHDLRGPLAAVQAHADLLIDGLLGELNEDQASSVTSVLDGVERMEALIDGLRGAFQEI